MKRVACSLLILLLCSTGVVAFTWAVDTCTVYMGSHNANLTLQGWGSNATCQATEHSTTNTLMEGLDILTLGGVDVRTHEGTPQGDVICAGWLHLVHYTVRDYGGLFDLNFYGNQLCSSLENGSSPYPSV
jgi:hypothetical protein